MVEYNSHCQVPDALVVVGARSDQTYAEIPDALNVNGGVGQNYAALDTNQATYASTTVVQRSYAADGERLNPFAKKNEKKIVLVELVLSARIDRGGTFSLLQSSN